MFGVCVVLVVGCEFSESFNSPSVDVRFDGIAEILGSDLGSFFHLGLRDPEVIDETVVA